MNKTVAIGTMVALALAGTACVQRADRALPAPDVYYPPLPEPPIQPAAGGGEGASAHRDLPKS